MKRAYRCWACGLLALVLALLAACAAVVYLVDPCFYYRVPTKWQPAFFSERYQSAGIIRSVPADTVLLGTSMVANCRPSQVAAAYGGEASRITLPDGYLSEFDKAVDLIFRCQDPERLVFAMDLNIMVRDESGKTRSMPDYLYDQNPLNDVKYLLNKDTLYYSVYTLVADGWDTGVTMDTGFTWDADVWWNHLTALENYPRPEVTAEVLPADAYLAHVDANLEVVEGWLTQHPDTAFDIYLSPYSMLYWDKTARLGQTEAVFAALERICEVLLPYENVRLCAPLFDEKIVEDLDNYSDYIHPSAQVDSQVLHLVKNGGFRLTAENFKETLAQWRQVVVNCDYDQYWTDDFWLRWNADHHIAG